MNTFNPGDKVLCARGAGVVGTIVEPTGVGVEGGYYVETPSGARHFADADQLTALPPNTPLFGRGGVRVATDAPDHAGRVGVVSSPEFRGATFGYWINFGPGDVAWIPAEVLSPLACDGGEPR